MSAWGEGLYENDIALDALGEIVGELEQVLEDSAAYLMTGIGLLVWLYPSSISADPDRFLAVLRAHPDWVAKSPELRRFAEDPVAFSEAPGSRPKEIERVLGASSDGVRVDALLKSQSLIDALAMTCREYLDDMAADDLYEAQGQLAPLGILLELTALGVTTDRSQVKDWRRAFDAADKNTTGERGFFDTYAARVRTGFAMLERS
jgi:hypothetical protein